MSSSVTKLENQPYHNCLFFPLLHSLISILCLTLCEREKGKYNKNHEKLLQVCLILAEINACREREMERERDGEREREREEERGRILMLNGNKKTALKKKQTRRKGYHCNAVPALHSTRQG